MVQLNSLLDRERKRYGTCSLVLELEATVSTVASLINENTLLKLELMRVETVNDETLEAAELEAAARELCKLRKINPEATVILAPQERIGGALTGTYIMQWQLAAREIVAFRQVQLVSAAVERNAAFAQATKKTTKK